jgi:uncharacterized membrane protein
MDPKVSEILNLIFRWIHVVAGVMWVGHLWFFNFVNAQVAKTYDADSKKKVIPELMPRALYWFRWGAAYTWITGFLLLGIVYYSGGAGVEANQSNGLASAVGVGSLVVGWIVYDLLWKQLAKREPVGAGISFVLIVVAAFALNMVMSGRAVFIHIGAIFGTIMATNVWMRIWPNQRKIIAAVKAGTAPPEGVAPLAALRSKHNTYMSVPLLFFMISNHFPTIYGDELRWVYAGVFVAIGWGLTNLIYAKSASAAPTQYEPSKKPADASRAPAA